MPAIESIRARQILDSRGNPTVEVDLRLKGGGWGRAAVPSGASTGAHEAVELRDDNPKIYHGKSVLKAIANVNSIISFKIMGVEFSTQQQLDAALNELDGTPTKSRLGANALLGVSLAFARAGAHKEKRSLFRYLGGEKAVGLPVPLMNVINGGAHANNGLDVQEFMIVPVCGGSFREALRAGSEIFHTLKKILHSKRLSTAVGDEGGFAPQLGSNVQALELLMEAIEKSGYIPGTDILLALDVAATELYQDGRYRWEGKSITGAQLMEIYAQWCEKFPIASIEDGFSEDDWASWIQITAKLGNCLQLVGDDLFVTNPRRLAQGIEQKAANALLVKVNQIGTLSETIEAVQMAHRNNFRTVMSHRSGETEDTTIADLAVALGCHQIKTGSLCRAERTAKYNQLLRIEEELGDKAVFWGKKSFQAYLTSSGGGHT